MQARRGEAPRPRAGRGRGPGGWRARGEDPPRPACVKPGRGEAAASLTRGQPGELLGRPELRLELGGFGVTLLTAVRAGEKQVAGGLVR